MSLIFSSLLLLLDNDDADYACDELTSCGMVSVDAFHIPLVNFENDERERHAQRDITTFAVSATDACESAFNCVFDSNESFLEFL